MSHKSGVPAMHYAIIIGIIGFLFIKAVVEPWVIEVMCRELIKCW